VHLVMREVDGKCCGDRAERVELGIVCVWHATVDDDVYWDAASGGSDKGVGDWLGGERVREDEDFGFGCVDVVDDGFLDSAVG
jgi:hypothetical protein